MTQSYEMIYILRPDLMEEQVQQEINKYRDFLKEHKAEDIQIKNWGKRRLAYPIKKYQDGFYVQINYKADGQQIAPLERAMRLSDEVIRYLTIKQKKEQLNAPESEGSQITESPKSVEEPVKPAESPKPVEEPVKPAGSLKPAESIKPAEAPVEAVEVVEAEVIEAVEATEE